MYIVLYVHSKFPIWVVQQHHLVKRVKTFMPFFLQGSVNFKFGVLYAKQGQTTDDEMFSNGKYSR